MLNIDVFFQSLSKLIMVDVVDTYWSIKYGNALKETDNALKTEWFALFPSLERLKIITLGIKYAFRLDVLLKSMKEISPTLSVVIDDSYDVEKWTKKAMTDKVSAEYHAAGWNTKYDDEYKGDWGNDKGALVIDSITD